MKQRCFKAKVFITLLATLILLGALCSFAFAADVYKPVNGAYGQAVPTNKNYEDEITHYNFYGDEATLHIMQISAGKKGAYYAVEIYSDKEYTNRIRTLNMEFPKEKGRSTIEINWPFKDTESGTYFGKCYSYIKTTDSNGEENKTIDSTTMSEFTVNINRVGKKTVKLTGITNAAKGVKVSWEKFPTAKSYLIYRKGSGDKSWKLIDTVKGSKSYFVDSTAKSGKTYTYTVKCKDIKYTSKYDKKGLTIKYLAMPTPTLTATGVNGYATLKWTKVSGAAGYYVYRKGGSLSNYTWEKIATIKNPKTLTYTDKKATNPGWAYTYTVKAYKDKAESGYLATGVDFNYLKAPVIKKIANYDGGLKISWSYSDADAIKYTVYRKDGKKWKKIGETASKYFIDTKAAAGVKNTYTVKAVAETNVGAYNDKGVSEKYIPTPKPTKPVFNNKYHATITWNSVKGATGYYIYKKVGETGNYKKIDTVKGKDTTTYTDKANKTANKAYTYTVRAFDKKGLMSAYDKKGATTVCLVMPVVTLTQISTEDTSLQINISWKAIKGAEKYNVYRRIEGSKNWKLIKKGTTQTTFVDVKDILSSTTYEYAVRAIHANGDMSSYRNPKKITPLQMPKILDLTASKDEGTTLSWNSIAASCYNVYRLPAQGADTDWEKVGTVETTSFTDKKTDGLGQQFYYAVTAVFGNKESIKSIAVANFVELTAESKVVEDENGSFDIVINWICPEGAKITLEKAKVEDEIVGEFAPITTFGELTENEYVDMYAEKGCTYAYKVIAELDGRLANYATTTCKRLYDRLPAATVTVSADNDEDSSAVFTITWDRIANAEEYIVMRSEDMETWTEVVSIPADEDTSYQDTGLELDKEYYYKVIAKNETEDRPESESEVRFAKAYAPVGSITDFNGIQQAGSNTVKLSWKAIKYAESCEIYRKNSSGEWDLLEVIKVDEDGILLAEYFDSTLTADGTYEYKIVAKAENRDSSEATISVVVKIIEKDTTEEDKPAESDPEATEPDSKEDTEA